MRSLLHAATERARTLVLAMRQVRQAFNRDHAGMNGEPTHDDLLAEVIRLRDERLRSATEIMALRQIIADAPHEVGCKLTVVPQKGYPPIEFGGPCNCWKSRVEKGEV